jgi:transposase-like protein
MARLRPLNAAVCTGCGSKKTRRAGFSSEKRKSVWVCDDCKNTFTVPLLVLAKS